MIEEVSEDRAAGVLVVRPNPAQSQEHAQDPLGLENGQQPVADLFERLANVSRNIPPGNSQQLEKHSFSLRRDHLLTTPLKAYNSGSRWYADSWIAASL